MITTIRTILRPIEPADNNRFFEYRSDAEANKYQGWIPKKLKEADDFISNNPVKFNESGTWFQLAIVLKETNLLIGDIGIHFIDEFQCEIGCTLDKNYHGQGYASESLKAVVDYLFNILKKHRIIASVEPQNTSSINLVERLGFRQEAHFQKSIFLRGKWVDDLVFAILKEEWQ